MKIKVDRSIQDNKFTTVLKFEEWGGKRLTAEEEKELLENFPCEVAYNDIKFEGRFKVDEKNNAVLLNLDKAANKEVVVQKEKTTEQKEEKKEEKQIVETHDEHMEAPQMGKAHIEVSDEHGTKETHTMEIEDTSKQVDNIPEGDLVTLSIINKVTPLDDKFQVKYEVTTSEVLDTELGKCLKNKELVCQAKTILFETRVIDKIIELIKQTEEKDSDFEKKNPREVII